MDQLSAQQQAITEALQQAWADDDGGYYDDEGYYDPEGLEDAYDGEYDGDDQQQIYSREDLADAVEAAVGRTLDREQAQVESEVDILERDANYDELKLRLPMLQDDDFARRVIGRAYSMAESWDPALIQGPGFVGLIELVAKAAVGDHASAQAMAAPRVQLESASGARMETSSPRRDDPQARMIALAKQETDGRI